MLYKYVWEYNVYRFDQASQSVKSDRRDRGRKLSTEEKKDNIESKAIIDINHKRPFRANQKDRRRVRKKEN